jgi:hypothetical protein
MSKDYDFINSIIIESKVQILELEIAKLQMENSELKKKLEEFNKVSEVITNYK